MLDTVNLLYVDKEWGQWVLEDIVVSKSLVKGKTTKIAFLKNVSTNKRLNLPYTEFRSKYRKVEAPNYIDRVLRLEGLL